MSSRGKNYTEREKCNLLQLVQKYQHIIGNKVTNAVSIVKKNEAWGCITAEYNSTAEVPRTQKQLNTAYLNLKRSTRQKVATENVKKYLEPRQNNTVVDCEAGPSQFISLSDESNIQVKTEEIKCIIGQFKKDETMDKKGVMATGGGLYKPVLSSVGSQMLTVMGDHVKPVSNHCDSASTYFKNDEDDVTISEVVPRQVTKSPVHQNNDDTSPTNTNPIQNECTNGRHVCQKKKCNRNNNQIKKQYYQTKLQCAIIEKKTRLLEYKVTLKKQKLLDLEMKIKQKEYENILNKS